VFLRHPGKEKKKEKEYNLRNAPFIRNKLMPSADPTLNGHLKYPNNLDQSLNDAAAEKIRKYRADYNNRPPSAVSFMPPIPSTSGRLRSEFVRLLFLQSHRETDRFFAASGVQSAQSTSVLHFRRAAFLSGLKSKAYGWSGSR
jgi:hypothetical protein